MQAKVKTSATKAPAKSIGTKIVEKYRPRMNGLTDAERQKLMERGMQLIYGQGKLARRTHRG